MRKRLFIIIIFTVITCFVAFGETKIATTYHTDLTIQDILDIFLEECNKPRYLYQVWDYHVYTDESDQNYAWAVAVNTDGYTYKGAYGSTTKVYERSVYLYMKNGYLAYKTFGGPTQTGMKDCFNGNEEFDKIVASCKSAVSGLLDESSNWIKRYKKEYRPAELLGLDRLSTLNNIFAIDKSLGSFWYTTNDRYKDYMFITDNSVIDKIKNLNFTETTWHDDLIDVSKRHNVIYFSLPSENVNNRTVPSVSQLKKYLNDGYDEFLVCDFQKAYYKVVNNKVFFYYAKVCWYVKMQDLINSNGDTLVCNGYYTYK